MAGSRLEAILMCDTVVIAPDGKAQLQGIFDRIFALSLPASHQMAWLYFRCIIDHPKAPYTRVNLGINRPDGFTEKMGELKVPVRPDGVVEGTVVLQNLLLRSEGFHHIDLFVEEQKVGSYRFAVELAKTSQGGQPKNAGSVN